jgi:hypothetical protein
MRDDFLMRCHDHAALSPVFGELTPLGPMTREGLRRAVVEPAARQGYRFEDEALVEEILNPVEGVRGSLPLLVFAVSRLWETRDREKKLLRAKPAGRSGVSRGRWPSTLRRRSTGSARSARGSSAKFSAT